MNDVRSFASLSGSLLARKGGAKPAMRPRALGSGGMLDDLGWDDMGYEADQPAQHVPSSIAGLTPVPRNPTARDEQPPVHVQQRALAERFADPAPAVAPSAEPEAAEPVIAEPVAAPPVAAEPVAPDPVVARQVPAPRASAKVVVMPRKVDVAGGRKSAFTLRLDTARHLRLRLAVAVTGQSAQQLVTGALDRFLETIPEVGNLAEQLPARSTKRS